MFPTIIHTIDIIIDNPTYFRLTYCKSAARFSHISSKVTGCLPTNDPSIPSINTTTEPMFFVYPMKSHGVLHLRESLPR